ncbi:CRISPR-associated protein Cas4 [Methanothermobacter sp.]|uniref:CRISPR-associated protein Cas4 n=1 Tax=Methanothermobacter sp. TaxID=1884223 RepID=UPI00262B88BB|nr:CRISPR-associated protein Cas4 [Methanothermobacter sp.]MDI9619146.1 CRISPR-associated protein Cas4 [Methanothermobacter sp.]
MSDLGKNLLVRGTQINYYFICETKLWLFSHNIHMEHESDLVEVGRILHEESYQRENKELVIDGLLSADFIKKGDTLEVHEVKKSAKMEEAHTFQLLYYIYYLKTKKAVEDIKGFIDYPKLRKRREVHLTPEIESKIEKILEKIDLIVRGEFPSPKKKMICKKCAYREFCWA